jgi:hypothetical protein
MHMHGTPCTEHHALTMRIPCTHTHTPPWRNSYKPTYRAAESSGPSRGDPFTGGEAYVPAYRRNLVDAAAAATTTGTAGASPSVVAPILPTTKLFPVAEFVRFKAVKVAGRWLLLAPTSAPVCHPCVTLAPDSPICSRFHGYSTAIKSTSLI